MNLNNEEKYAYYIDLKVFLESNTGTILLSQIKEQHDLLSESIAGLVSKINSPKAYDESKEDFLDKKNKLKANRELTQNFFDIKAIEGQIVSLKKILDAS